MNLEEKIEEGFLTRLGRKGRKIILPWIATSIFTLGCERDITGPEDKKSKQEVVVSKTRTDVQGKAYFIENQTQEQVEVQVVDTNNNPLQKSNLDIAFEDGINVEALFLQDPTGEYIPSRDLFNSSSSVKKISGNQIRTLKTGKSEEFGGIYHIETVKDKNAGQLLVDWRQENGYGGWTLHYYLFTVNKEDAIKYYETQGKISDFFYNKFIYVFGTGKDKKVKPSDFIDLILKYGEVSGDINAERWDVYAYSGKHITDNISFVPSNAPTLTLNEPRVEGSNVTFIWKGSDETIYKQIPTYFPIREDPTILLDPTKDSDLKYFYKIFRNNVIVLQDSTVDNYKNYKNLEDGDYTLEVLVKDEVENKSEVKNKKFSIKSSVQEKSFNIFDYAILTEGSYWNYTNDYYEKIIDVGEYDGKKIAIIENPSSGEFLWISSSAVYVFGVNVWHDSSYNLFFNPPAKMGDSKMEIGDSFNNSFYVYSDTDYSEKMGNGKYNLEYLRLETVTVPAGTFKDCLVTREYSEYNIEDYNISGYSYRWLAKGVGFVKAEDSKGTVYKLKSYSVK